MIFARHLSVIAKSALQHTLVSVLLEKASALSASEGYGNMVCIIIVISIPLL